MADEEIYDLGLRLKKLREDRNLTQKQVAERLDVAKDTIYRYEANLQMPTSDKLAKLARIYHTSTDYIMGLDDKTVLKIYGLSERQKECLENFVDIFIDKDDDK